MNTESLFEQMQREAAESVLRRKRAARSRNLPPDMESLHERSLQRNHGSNFAAIEERIARRHQRNDVEDLIVNRDPCFACGVRRDQHDQLGCKRWRGER